MSILHRFATVVGKGLLLFLIVVVVQSLSCDPMDCSLRGSMVDHGISQARILELVAISFSRESS